MGRAEQHLIVERHGWITSKNLTSSSSYLQFLDKTCYLQLTIERKKNYEQKCITKYRIKY